MLPWKEAKQVSAFPKIANSILSFYYTINILNKSRQIYEFQIPS